jgi:hypothetical protein
MDELTKFRDFLLSLPHAHKIIVAGNHDITLDWEFYEKRGRNRFHPNTPQNAVECKALLADTPGITYLQDSGCEVLGLNIWGSPWQPEFCDWAFNCERGAYIRKYWDLIPDKTDILVTHGPPFGHGDLTSNGTKVGCEDLMVKIKQVKPLVHVFGHIHEGYGVTTADGTTFVNASTCNLRYRPTNPAVVLDLLPAEYPGTS